MHNWNCPVCHTDNQGDFPDYNFCDTCDWQDDPTQRADPAYSGGANNISLNQFKKEWRVGQSIQNRELVAV